MVMWQGDPDTGSKELQTGTIRREPYARQTRSKDARFGVSRTRWRLRVFNNVDALAFVGEQEAMLDAHGFFTAESAARHFLARLSPEWHEITHFVILIEREDDPSDDEEKSSAKEKSSV